jgi:hypothetical protein
MEYYLFDEPGLYQSELMTWVARNLVNNEMPGWIFFLDADEFLPFKSKEDFDRRLLELDSFPLIVMPWLNLVPLDMESGGIVEAFFLKPPIPSPLRKIAFQPNLIAPEDYVVGHGNHVLVKVNKRGKKKFSKKSAFPIYHVPIRTKQQLRQKIMRGVESFGRMGSDRADKTGFHWDEIYRIMETRSLTNEMMAGIVARYGEPLGAPYERGLDQLRTEGYIEMKMDVCFSPLMFSFRDLENSADEGSDKKVAISSHASNQRKRPYKISFDPLTRSVHLSG